MRLRLLTLAAASTACALTGGCAIAGAGAAAGVGLFALQERTIGAGIDDAAASQQIKSRMLAADASGFAEVDVEVSSSIVLLSGAAPSEQHRQTAEMIARNVGSVTQIYNEIFVGPRSGFVRSAQDELITTQIRARLLASPSVRAINVNIETYHGSVYLMGLARTDAELRRAAEIASYVPGVERVVSFMRVRQPAGYVAAAPPPQTPNSYADAAY